MRINPIFFCFLFCLCAIHCQSQDVPLGGWKDYLSYQQGLTVCQGGNTIYCGCSSGVFSYNTQDNSMERFNKITGLSDIDASVARYNNYDNVLVIGYSDGNIDLLENGQIINIPDLANSSVQGSKAINNVYFNQNLAYISCGQGIIVMDLTQNIILNTYYIGPNATALNIYDITIFNDTLFAATSKGIYKDAINDPFINDYQDWYANAGRLPAGQYNSVVSCGNKMYACYSMRLTHNTYTGDSIFVYQNGVWSLFKNFIDQDYIPSMESSAINGQNYLICSGLYYIRIYDSAGNQINAVAGYGFSAQTSNDVILDNSGNIWVADNNYGLVKTDNDGTGTSYIPPGPFSNKAFAIANENGTIWIAPGGYNNSHAPEYINTIGLSEFSNNTWTRLLDTKLNDLVCVAIDPKNPLHAYAGSYGAGLVECNNNTLGTTYNASNSSLQYVNGLSSDGIRVGGVAFDSNGNLWATNSLANTQFLSVKKTDGTWQAFDFHGILPNNSQSVQLLVTQSGAKWMLSPGNGILVYEDQGTFATPSLNNSVLISTQIGQGHLPSTNIYSMAQDQNGAVWVGTDAQVVVFYSPNNVIDGNHDWDAQNVYVTQTGFTQYLMQNQFTTAIAIDGANRKWIGTLGGGVFLMSPDGTQHIANYTTSNSPILSNNILGIAINQQTGEVFFATDKGVVSFRGTATESNPAFTNVYAFPDPVPHGYSGPVAIKGLVANTDVKITTVNGELVYHTTSLGGQAVWNGLNFDGLRVQTGVYMVFCASPDGSQTFVTKLLFIN